MAGLFLQILGLGWIHFSRHSSKNMAAAINTLRRFSSFHRAWMKYPYPSRFPSLCHRKGRWMWSVPCLEGRGPWWSWFRFRCSAGMHPFPLLRFRLGTKDTRPLQQSSCTSFVAPCKTSINNYLTFIPRAGMLIDKHAKVNAEFRYPCSPLLGCNNREIPRKG